MILLISFVYNFFLINNNCAEYDTRVEGKKKKATKQTEMCHNLHTSPLISVDISRQFRDSCPNQNIVNRYK